MHPLQSPEAFRAARHQLGLSANKLAGALGVAEGRTIRRWEAGDSDIPGPVARLLAVWLDPACPPHLGPPTSSSQDIDE